MLWCFFNTSCFGHINSKVCGTWVDHTLGNLRYFFPHFVSSHILSKAMSSSLLTFSTVYKIKHFSQTTCVFLKDDFWYPDILSLLLVNQMAVLNHWQMLLAASKEEVCCKKVFQGINGKISPLFNIFPAWVLLLSISLMTLHRMAVLLESYWLSFLRGL